MHGESGSLTERTVIPKETVQDRRTFGNGYSGVVYGSIYA